MPVRDSFPVTIWIGQVLTGPTARRAYMAIVLLLLVATTVARISSFLLTRKIQAVICGLSTLSIDESSEAEVLRTVPYLVRGRQDLRVDRDVERGNIDRGVERFYSADISNEPHWLKFGHFALRFSGAVYQEGQIKSWPFIVADLLGYRYIGFSATVILFNGKVSAITYGIANKLIIPRRIGNIVSVRSFHSYFAPHQHGFEVGSTVDENPQLHFIRGNDQQLAVLFAFDMPAALKSHVFQVDLNCFWSFHGCRHPGQIAPLLWQDKTATQTATLTRIESTRPCPDWVLAERVRYFPDVSIVLLESKGFENRSVNEDGLRVDEVWTNYELIEMLRGSSLESWTSVRSKITVPYPGDYSRTLANTGLLWAEAGKRVIAFSNLTFDSCRMVPATPSALSSVRNALSSPRRFEDEELLDTEMVR